MTASAVKLSEEQRGRVAFEHRESLARAARRMSAGETPQVCEECSTDDVDQPAHAARCSSFVPEAAPTPTRPKRVGTGPDAWYVDEETGKRLHAAARSKDGSKTQSEMTRESMAWADAQPTVTRCGLCHNFEIHGTAAECRKEFRRHLEREHPEIAKRTQGRRRSRRDGQSAAQAEAEQRRQTLALAAMDAGDPVADAHEVLPAAGSAVPSLLPDGAQATDAAGGEAFPERPATDSQADTPPVGHADGDAGRSDNVELSDGNDPAAFAARKRRRKPYTDAEIEAAFTRFHRERGRWPLPSDAKTCAYLPHGAGSLRSTRFGSWQGVWDHFDAGKVPTGMGARNYRDAARDSSRERAASQPEPRGHARPGDGGGRDAQRPGTGARTLAATADGCGGAGQARPAPEPQPASAASPAAAATAPPSTLSHEDATTVSKLLRALADALDAGLFHQSNLAVLLDGLAVEVRRRLPETA